MTIPAWLGEAVAAQRAGRPDPNLGNERSLVAAFCWIAGHPAEAADLKGPIDAAIEAAGGYDRLLMSRDSCDRCGERYRLENLSLCIECVEARCPNCARPRCACGGEMVG